jgi:hypothetical protein
MLWPCYLLLTLLPLPGCHLRIVFVCAIPAKFKSVLAF